MPRRGLVLVVSAPSGAGKTTLCRRLLEEDPEISFSVSYTTRPPRPQEQHGKDYFFVDRPTFEAMIQEGEFLEWAEVYGNLYGTARSQVLARLQEGHDVLLDIDVQGAFQVRQKLGPEAVLVFILPPSLEELAKRLRARSTEDEETIKKRLAAAEKEIKQAEKFDYLVLNEDLEEAYQTLRAILQAERQRPFRRPDLLSRF